MSKYNENLKDSKLDIPSVSPKYSNNYSSDDDASKDEDSVKYPAANQVNFCPVVSPVHSQYNNRRRGSSDCFQSNAVQQFSDIDNQSTISERLINNFRFYRKECIEAALTAGVTVPIDMIEDKSGSLLSFIDQRGPRYLLQIMYSNADSVHLLRCSLSLLIVTISILWRKIPVSSQKSNNNSNISGRSKKFAMSWAEQSLNMIGDSSAVAICINLLWSTHIEGIQELILNLIAHLVRISDEALYQMLETPKIQDANHNNEQKNNKLTNDSESPGSILSNSTTGLLPKQNKSAMSTSVIIPVNTPTNSTMYRKVSMGVITGKSIQATAQESILNRDITCLSYMFSVAEHQRNSFAIMSGCADIILAMMTAGDSIVCEAIAKTSTSTLTTANEQQQQSLEVTKKSTSSTSEIINKRIILSDIIYDHKPKTKKEKDPNIPVHLPSWKGLKLLINFLRRYARYMTPPQEGSLDNIDKGFLTDHKSKLYDAHAKVLSAVCELIIGAPVVAAHVANVSQKITIIRSCESIYQGNEAMLNTLARCSAALRQSIIEKDRKESQKFHSLSYEASHTMTAPSRKEREHHLPSPRNPNNLNRNSCGANKSYSLFDPRPTHICSKFQDHEQSWMKLHDKEASSYLDRPSTASDLIGGGNWSRPTSPVFRNGLYEVAESPPRRGLTADKKGFDARLRRDFFSHLPELPRLPCKVSDGEDLREFLMDSEIFDVHASKAHTMSQLSRAIYDAKRIGQVYNGHHSVSIRERARRIYTPIKKSRSRSSSQYHNNSGKVSPKSLSVSLTLHPNNPSNTQSSSLLKSTPKSSLSKYNDRGGEGEGGEEEEALDDGPYLPHQDSQITHISGLTMEGMSVMERPDIAEAYTDHVNHFDGARPRTTGSAFEKSSLCNTNGRSHNSMVQSYDIIFP